MDDFDSLRGCCKDTSTQLYDFIKDTHKYMDVNNDNWHEVNKVFNDLYELDNMRAEQMEEHHQHINGLWFMIFLTQMITIAILVWKGVL